MNFATTCTGIMIPKNTTSQTMSLRTVSFMAQHNTMWYSSTKGTF